MIHMRSRVASRTREKLLFEEIKPQTEASAWACAGKKLESDGNKGERIGRKEKKKGPRQHPQGRRRKGGNGRNGRKRAARMG